MRMPQDVTPGGPRPMGETPGEEDPSEDEPILWDEHGPGYTPGWEQRRDSPAQSLISAASSHVNSAQMAASRPAGGGRKVQIRRPGRLRKARTTGGTQGWDVQRRPNFSIEEVSAKEFTLIAREVNSGVYAQIRSLLKRVQANHLFVDAQKMTKKQALDYIPPALRKGSVNVRLL